MVPKTGKKHIFQKIADIGIFGIAFSASRHLFLANIFTYQNLFQGFQ